MKRYLLLALLLLDVAVATAQLERPYRQFVTQQVQEQVLAQDASFAANLASMEQYINGYGTAGNGRADTIAVVFHVLYQAGSAHPSLEQVMAQLDVLNLALGAYTPPTEPYTLAQMQAFSDGAVDAGIHFCMPSLSASINFVETGVAEWEPGQAMKSGATGGADPWDPEHYLNIWVCNLKGHGAGYAQLPGGPAASDGIVLDFDYLPGFVQGEGYPYGGGKTLVHLIGSYLGLYELWNFENPCTDDYVGDTPIHNAPNFGLSDDYHHVSLCEDGDGKPEMVINYMDNTDDVALSMFTQGQKNRLKAVLSEQGPRYGLTNGCQGLGLREDDNKNQATQGQPLDGKPTMLLFPNPAAGQFSVKIVGGKVGRVKLSAHSMIGELVWQGDFDLESEHHVASVNGRSWSAGLYSISATLSDGTTISQKLNLQFP
ncbi:MAG: hypothetical protein HY842_05120 [Bacteroidetes bacterium]|nr:hypothetical protein [Bacteroidota bacterium]